MRQRFGKRAPLGHAPAIARRGDLVQFQWWVSIFEPQSDRKGPLQAGRRAFTRLRDGEECP
jgi:hypothetical protein